MRDILQRREPAFVELLTTTTVIQLDYFVCIRGVEICGWIIESEMPIFADACEGHVDRVTLGKPVDERWCVDSLSRVWR